MNKWTRPREGRMIAGVVAGLAKMTGMEVSILRLITIGVAIFTGFFPVALLYLAAILIVPEER